MSGSNKVVITTYPEQAVQQQTASQILRIICFSHLVMTPYSARVSKICKMGYTHVTSIS